MKGVGLILGQGRLLLGALGGTLCFLVPSSAHAATPGDANPQSSTEYASSPPKQYGMSVGVRCEVDVLGFDATSSFTPAVSLGYTQKNLGGVLTVLMQSSPGVRLEGQYHPFTLGWVRPYARLGTTAFFREQGAQGERTFLGGVSGRGGIGLDLRCFSRASVFADAAYERFFTGSQRYRSQSALFSVGVNWFP